MAFKLPAKIIDFLSSKGLDTVLEALKFVPIPVIGAVANTIDKVKDSIVGHQDFKALPVEEQKAFLDLYEAETARMKQEDEAEIAKLKAQNEELANVRASNVVIQTSEKASWLSKNVSYGIDIFVTLIWGVITIFLCARILKAFANGSPIPDMTAIMGIYAAVNLTFGTILQFHRGSSSSSKVNADVVRQIAKSNL